MLVMIAGPMVNAVNDIGRREKERVLRGGRRRRREKERTETRL
jgi:hypothetical protein